MKGKYTKRRGVATKTMVMVLALVLVIGISVGGTLAWLTAQTGEVTNTFSVGDINISLAETTSSYKIVPGGKSAKDPTITVTGGSESCYVYVSVTNNLVIGTDVVGIPNISSTDWTPIGTNGNETVYRYKAVVTATEDTKLPVFTEVSYSSTLITKENINSLKDKTIVIQGYAHQSENTTQDVADAAANAFFGITANG